MPPNARPPHLTRATATTSSLAARIRSSHASIARRSAFARAATFADGPPVFHDAVHRLLVESGPRRRCRPNRRLRARAYTVGLAGLAYSLSWQRVGARSTAR